MKRIGLLGVLVVAAAAVTAGMLWQQHGGAEQRPRALRCANGCCALPEPNRPAKRVAIPDGSGLPCLVEFEIGGSKAAATMAPVLQQLETNRKGKLSVLRVDPDRHQAAAARWRLRTTPTQLLVSVKGEELWRHEGTIGAAELGRKLDEAVH
ncbi:MAG: thioredoxin family protein [Armatimonadia bacterium]